MDLIGIVEREGHLLSVAARHDFRARIPACPDWDVDELLRHTGGAHRNAEVIVRERRTERPDRSLLEAPSVGSLDWYEAGLAALVETFRTTDPATPVYTFAGPGTAAFWQRRMAHETTVHRVDAEQATGATGPVDAGFAVDGIDEYLDVFLPLAARRVEAPPQGTLHLHATDVEGEWLVRLGDAPSVERGHAKGDVALRGPAADLYLWVWGRVPTERLEVFGDETLADGFARYRL